MSKLFPDVSKHRRELVKVVPDGSAKTFVYKDLDEEESRGGLWERFFCKQPERSQEEVKH